MILKFADVEIELAKGEIRRAGQPVRAAPRVASLLHLLASNADRVVSKEEIIEKIWDGRAISDSAVSTSVKEARQAIGDSGDRQEYIRTLHGTGFRCVAEVRLVRPAAAEPEAVGVPLAKLQLGKPSLAVLPFGNVNAENRTDPLGDGLAAELISALSRLRYLSVTARGSSFRFRQSAPDLQSISTVLGVRYCLSGLLEADESGIAITVELSRTTEGVVIWSERFAGRKEQIHEFRAQIVAAVISALDLHIPLNEAQAAQLLSPTRLDAWAEYHLGLQHLFRFNPQDNALAEKLFTSAVGREPGFARAHAGLSFVAFQNAFMGYGGSAQAEKQSALAHAEKSLALDLLDPFANYCMGRAQWMTGNLEAADTWLGRSLEISPNYAQGHYLRALTGVMLGQGEPIRKGNEKAMALSPLDPLFYAMLGTQAQSFIIDENYEEAANWADSAAAAPGSHYLLGMVAAAAHELKGDHSAALRWAEKTKSRRPDATVERFLQAFPYKDEKNRNRMRRALLDSGM